jgi:hypothetical protein
MSHKVNIDELFNQMANEVHSFIKVSENGFSERWVPATYIKSELNLTKNAYPQGNKTDNKTGWLFATLARHLQDTNKVDFKKVGSRSFYKTKA